MDENISYRVIDISVFESRREPIPLTARTDRGALIQAKKLGLKNYSVRFFRRSDGCDAEIYRQGKMDEADRPKKKTHSPSIF